MAATLLTGLALTGSWWNVTPPKTGGALGTTPVAVTSDSVVNYSTWSGGAPRPAGVATTFYARWTGTFTPSVSGNYVFGIDQLDTYYINDPNYGTGFGGGVANLTVNGTVVFNDLSGYYASLGASLPPALTNNTYYTPNNAPRPMALTAGVAYPVVLESGFQEYTSNSAYYGIQLLLVSFSPVVSQTLGAGAIIGAKATQAIGAAAALQTIAAPALRAAAHISVQGAATLAAGARVIGVQRQTIGAASAVSIQAIQAIGAAAALQTIAAPALRWPRARE